MSKNEKITKKQQQGVGGKSQSQKSQPAKSKQPKSVTKPEINEDVKREQKLQAVVLSDSFVVKFGPITSELPKVLIPVVNIPMIDYTFEFLSQNGVEEIVVFCVSHAEKIQNYIDSSKWPSMVSIKCVSSASCVSEGDALRELDSMNIVRSDPFVLIRGDVVSNLNLKTAITYHKQKRIEDPNNVMTVILKKVQHSSHLKPILDDLVVAVNNHTSQILLFDNAVTDSSLRIPLELLEQQEAMSFHTDLLDCNIDICSPEFLLQFSDNFDYQNIRKDFIHNEVSNWSLGKHIYGYVIENEYAARIIDPRSYHAVCRDIVRRWVFPMVPDSQVVRDGLNFSQLSNYAYKETGVKVARSAAVRSGVVVGQGCSVGAGATITNCVIGRHCHIESMVVLRDSHLWTGVAVGAGVCIAESILCDNVTIGEGAVIHKGCIISSGLTVGKNVVVPAFTRLIKSLHVQSDLLNGSAVWKASCDDEEMPEVECFLQDPTCAHNIGSRQADEWKRGLWTAFELPEDDQSDDEGDEDSFEQDRGTASQSVDFLRIVGEMVSTGHAEGHPADSLLMEIKGCKFAQNKSFADCVAGVVPAVMQIVVDQIEPFTSKTFLSTWTAILDASGPGWGHSLLKPLALEPVDQCRFITSMENFVLKNEKHSSSLVAIFRFLLQVAYDQELLGEDGIKCWIDLRRCDDAEDLDGHEVDAATLKLFHKPEVQAFVEWIEDEEDESGSEEDEDGESSAGSESD